MSFHHFYFYFYLIVVTAICGTEGACELFFEKQPHYMVQLRWALAPSKHVRSSSNLARLDWRVIAEGMVSNLHVIMRFSSLIVVS